MHHIHLYDTTLRDGTQREGISYSLDDKLKIAVTHDMASARRISDRVLMLHDGVIHADGPTADILGSREPVVYNFVNGIAVDPVAATPVSP